MRHLLAVAWYMNHAAFDLAVSSPYKRPWSISSDHCDQGLDEANTNQKGGIPFRLLKEKELDWLMTWRVGHALRESTNF